MNASQVTPSIRSHLDDLSRKAGYNSWFDFIRGLQLQDEPWQEAYEVLTDMIEGEHINVHIQD